MTSEECVIKIPSKDRAREAELVFRRIPAGTFRMGQRGASEEEEPVHRVRIEQDFWMMDTPVTQAQMAILKPDHANHFDGKPDHPAESISWLDAVEFARLTQLSVAVGWLSCLPTEAEWEYACRAGTITQYHSGDTEADLEKVAWFNEPFDTGSTHPVRGKLSNSANGFGLFDIHGNVWEWCHDVYDPDAYKTRIDGCVDPGFEERNAFYAAAAPSEEWSRLRVLRGGSWNGAAGDCRAAIRGRNAPGARFWVVGFRLVLVPGLQSKPSGGPSSGQGRRARDECGGNDRR